MTEKVFLAISCTLLMECWNNGKLGKGRNLIVFDLYPPKPSFHLSIIPLFQLGRIHKFIVTGAPRSKKYPFDYHNAGKLSRNICKIKVVHPS
jgi:hypothetical protein